MAISSSGKRRFTRSNPCPVCGGDDHDPRGAGRRCFGFASDDGEWVRCTREEFAGEAPYDEGSTAWIHKMHGACHCGVEHNPAKEEPRQQQGQKRKLLIAYNYMNASGDLLFQCVRWEPKGFSQRHPDGAGGWIWNLDGITPVLYRLPELLAADPKETVWIVEGEKDVEMLRKAGLIATCNPMGAGKWRSSYNASLKGRTVCIIPDADAPGKKHAEEVAWYLHGIAKSVKVVLLPSSCKDVSEYLAARGTVEKLQEFAATTPEWEKPGKSEGITPEQDAVVQRLETMTLREVLNMDFPEPEWVIPNMIPRGQVTVFAGKPKVGKSWWVFGGALAVAEGGKAFGTTECEQAPVLYLALEDTPRRLKGRGLKLLKGKNLHGLKAPEYLHLATSCPKLDEGAVEQMDTWLEDHVDCSLIIIDTLAKVKPARSKNGDIYAEDYGCVQGLIELAHRRNVGVLIVTHCRKMSGEDVFDEINASTGLLGAAETAIVMRRRRGEDTATLHITGKDVDEQELAMQFMAETGSWVILGDATEYAETKEQQEILDALKMLGGEATPKEVKEQLGPTKSPSAIKTLMWRMAQKGLLNNTDGKYVAATQAASTVNGTAVQSDVTHVTHVTAETQETHVTQFDDEEVGYTVSTVTPVSTVTWVTPDLTENAPDQAAAALEATDDLEQIRSEVLTLAQAIHWRMARVQEALRGGTEFAWRKFVEIADRPLLSAARVALQGAS
jgi:5S rRNA maturation endonuclease (ribonuclease M5)